MATNTIKTISRSHAQVTVPQVIYTPAQMNVPGYLYIPFKSETAPKTPHNTPTEVGNTSLATSAPSGTFTLSRNRDIVMPLGDRLSKGWDMLAACPVEPPSATNNLTIMIDGKGDCEWTSYQVEGELDDVTTYPESGVAPIYDSVFASAEQFGAKDPQDCSTLEDEVYTVRKIRNFTTLSAEEEEWYNIALMNDEEYAKFTAKPVYNPRPVNVPSLASMESKKPAIQTVAEVVAEIQPIVESKSWGKVESVSAARIPGKNAKGSVVTASASSAVSAASSSSSANFIQLGGGAKMKSTSIADLAADQATWANRNAQRAAAAAAAAPVISTEPPYTYIRRSRATPFDYVLAQGYGGACSVVILSDEEYFRKFPEEKLKEEKKSCAPEKKVEKKDDQKDKDEDEEKPRRLLPRPGASNAEKKAANTPYPTFRKNVRSANSGSKRSLVAALSMVAARYGVLAVFTKGFEQEMKSHSRQLNILQNAIAVEDEFTGNSEKREIQQITEKAAIANFKVAMSAVVSDFPWASFFSGSLNLDLLETRITGVTVEAEPSFFSAPIVTKFAAADIKVIPSVKKVKKVKSIAKTNSVFDALQEVEAKPETKSLPLIIKKAEKKIQAKVQKKSLASELLNFKSYIQEQKEKKAEMTVQVESGEATADVVRTVAMEVIADKPVLAKSLTKSAMCRHYLTRGKCSHTNCNFAHSIAELTPFPCPFDKTCKMFSATCQKCNHIHSSETKESWLVRRNIVDPNVQVAKPVVVIVTAPAASSSFEVAIPTTTKATEGQDAKTFWAAVPKTSSLTPELLKKVEEAKAKAAAINARAAAEAAAKAAAEAEASRLAAEEEAARIASRHVPLVSPAASQLTCSKMCNTALAGLPCTRQNCTFAHSLAQLNPSRCNHGCSCRYKSATAARPCVFIHPDETKDQWLSRSGQYRDYVAKEAQLLASIAAKRAAIEKTKAIAAAATAHFLAPSQTKLVVNFDDEDDEDEKVTAVASQPAPEFIPLSLSKSKAADLLVIRVPPSLAGAALEMAMKQGLSNFKIEIV